MTRKEYDRWLEELADSETPAVREIGEMAQQRAWELDDIIIIADEAPATVADAYEAYTGRSLLEDHGIDYSGEIVMSVEEALRSATNGGWISLHGTRMALWSDTRI